MCGLVEEISQLEHGVSIPYQQSDESERGKPWEYSATKTTVVVPGVSRADQGETGSASDQVEVSMHFSLHGRSLERDRTNSNGQRSLKTMWQCQTVP